MLPVYGRLRVNLNPQLRYYIVRRKINHNALLRRITVAEQFRTFSLTELLAVTVFRSVHANLKHDVSLMEHVKLDRISLSSDLLIRVSVFRSLANKRKMFKTLTVAAFDKVACPFSVSRPSVLPFCVEQCSPSCQRTSPAYVTCCSLGQNPYNG